MKRATLIVVAAALMLCSCGQGAGSQSGSAEQLTWQEQYDLGVRYLEDGNYEEAIIAFTAAIEIDPKRAENYVARGDAYAGYAQALAEDGRLNDDALEAYENAVKDYRTAIRRDKTDVSVYQKAAEVYIILGDTDSAAELIEKGLNATEDESLQDLQDELAGVIIPSELVQGSEEWNTLVEFLTQFIWCGIYDHETASYGLAGKNNIMEGLLSQNWDTGFPYHDELYPGEANEDVWYEPVPLDPLGRWSSYTKVNSDKLEWLLIHIFNCSRSDIEKMKDAIKAGQNEDIYYLDGYYYYSIDGFGVDILWPEIINIERKGMRYYVEYELWYQEINDDPDNTEKILFGLYQAEVSLKEIDGKTYWSLYRASEEKIN